MANIAGRGTFTYLHRYVYESAHGPIKPGYRVDHKCNKKRCLNEKHLRQLKNGDNVKRGMPYNHIDLTGHVVQGYEIVKRLPAKHHHAVWLLKQQATGKRYSAESGPLLAILRGKKKRLVPCPL